MRDRLCIPGYKILANIGIKTAQDVLCYSARDLLMHRGFGRKSLQKLERILNGYGLKLKESDWGSTAL
jgi:DNA-directed RNA polymerase alpha subunit